MKIVKQPTNSKITHIFHDIDGTHSLIRDWPPVMSVVLHYVIENGLPHNYDSDESLKHVISITGVKPLPETDSFCIESAGLSALTQMEWAIRRAIEGGKIDIDCDKEVNSEIIKLIWKGEELFDSFNESGEIRQYLADNTPRLFKFYENVLNGFCRDKNLAEAIDNPNKYIVRGSMEFMKKLKDSGIKNYFVTGAVVEKGMGIYEEVETLGYKIGTGDIIEQIYGSTWDKKLPKNTIMQMLAEQLGVKGENIAIIGDGRSEVEAGVKLGALCISRLPANAARQLELHTQLGTNVIIEDFIDPALFELIVK